MNAIQKRSGQYLGTRIDHQWWRRYIKGGFFARGIGEYWIKDGSLFFQHKSRQEPISLPLRDIIEIILCPCREDVGGIPILNLIWQKDGNWLSSGFVLSDIMDENTKLLARLRAGV